MQLAYLYVLAGQRRGERWRLRLLSYVETAEGPAQQATEEHLRNILWQARVEGVVESVCVRSLSLPLYQELAMAASRSPPQPGISGPGVQPLVLGELGDIDTAALQNAIVGAVSTYETRLVLLPLPPLPPPPPLDGSGCGIGVGLVDKEVGAWLTVVDQLSAGLPPCLMALNPTTAVISTRV